MHELSEELRWAEKASHHDETIGLKKLLTKAFCKRFCAVKSDTREVFTAVYNFEARIVKG